MNGDMTIADSGFLSPVSYGNGGNPTETALSFAEMLAEEIERPQIDANSQMGIGTGALAHNHQNEVRVNETLEKAELNKELLMSAFLGGGSGMGGIMLTMLMSQLMDKMDRNQAQPIAPQHTHNTQPANTAANSSVVNLAMTRLGDPYSQPKAGQDSYLDCSYFAMWTYRNFGVNLPRTAAEQANYCVENGLTVSKEQLQPGDLIFFSHNSNGRFMNVTHVGIYAGDGMMVDASSSRGEVVYRPVLDGAVLYGRPGSTRQSAQYGSL